MLTGQARWKEIMEQPISRGEAQALEDRLLAHIMSCACGIEAVENLLVSRGILKNDEVMAEVKRLLEQKSEQANAAVQTKSIVEA
jgi:hypothetical protein